MTNTQYIANKVKQNFILLLDAALVKFFWKSNVKIYIIIFFFEY